MRSRLITFVIVLLAVAMSANLIASIVTIAGRGSRVDDRREAYERAAQEHSQLERKLIEVQSPQYIEKAAREKLSMTHPGEQTVVLPAWVSQGLSSPSAVEADRSIAQLSPWQQWVALFFPYEK